MWQEQQEESYRFVYAEILPFLFGCLFGFLFDFLLGFLLQVANGNACYSFD